MLPPLDKVPPKAAKCLRFMSFNINGGKSLFNYHPWNLLRTYDNLASALNADILSLQELKIQTDAIAHVALVAKFRAFVSVPKEKKGYSGVALYVRIPTDEDPDHVRQALTVIRAEEGMTGRLLSAEKIQYKDLQSNKAIGGYLEAEEVLQMGLDETSLRRLDSEGRCVAVELAGGTVVFSVYCPANSQGSEEGQEFRMAFLSVLLKRCRKLHEMGKNVVLMGDINVSMDLIDNAEGIDVAVKEKRIVNNLREGAAAFEETNKSECLLFRSSQPHRTLLNSYVIPSLEGVSKKEQILCDTTRLIQKRRLAMYTVWNTRTGARQANFGSRIDLILASGGEFIRNVVNADILPFLYGSDHAPVFTDVDVSYQSLCPIEAPKIAFEARYFYKLVRHRDISSMFGAINKKRSVTPERTENSPKPQYVSRKKPKTQGQQSIGNFFFKDSKVNEDDRLNHNSNIKATQNSISQGQGGEVGNEKSGEVTNNNEEGDLPSDAVESSVHNTKNKDILHQKNGHLSSEEDQPPQMPKTIKINSVQSLMLLMYGNPPYCKHKEPCILKTSLTKATKGKRFWCCPKENKGSYGEMGDHRCDYFEWAKPNAGKAE